MNEKLRQWFQTHDVPYLVHENNPQNKHAAVIVEFRSDPWFPLVVRRTMNVLGQNWNLYIFHGTENEEFVKQSFPKWKIECLKLPAKNINKYAYSRLLRDIHFWNCIKEERILIFQTDTFLIRAPTEEVWDYAFCGAPSGYGGQTLNGGLSTRLNSIMKNLCSESTNLLIAEEEDQFFSRCIQDRFPRLFPPFKFAADRFLESNLLCASLIGVHGTDKKYIPDERWEADIFPHIK